MRALQDLLRSAVDGATADTAAAAFSSLSDGLANMKATDADIHAAFLEVLPSSAASHLARFVSSFAGRISTCSELWTDLTERRGSLCVAVVDVLLNVVATSPNTSAAEEAENDAALVVDAISTGVKELAVTQRGCITLMRLVSAVHHRKRLIDRVITSLRDNVAPLLDGVHSPYVFGHVLSGLHAPRTPEAGDVDYAASGTDDVAIPSLPSTLAGGCVEPTRRRAMYIIDFAPWLQLADAPSPPFGGQRDRCSRETWIAFASALCNALRNHLRVVLFGRQQCFVLWHALRRLPVFELESGAALLASLASPIQTAVWPPPGKPGVSSGTEPEAGSTLPSQTTAVLSPFQALCRSTAGRCALVVLLKQLAEYIPRRSKPCPTAATPRKDLLELIASAFVRLAQDGVPIADRSQELTLKMRPGMDAAATLETTLSRWMDESITPSPSAT